MARITTGSQTSPSVLEVDAQATALVTAFREENHVTIWAAPFPSSEPASIVRRYQMLPAIDAQR